MIILIFKILQNLKLKNGRILNKHGVDITNQLNNLLNQKPPKWDTDWLGPF